MNADRRVVERMVRLASELHAHGRAATSRGSRAEGVAFRVAANAIRRELDLAPIGYDGDDPWTVGPDPFMVGESDPGT